MSDMTGESRKVVNLALTPFPESYSRPLEDTGDVEVAAMAQVEVDAHTPLGIVVQQAFRDYLPDWSAAKDDPGSEAHFYQIRVSGSEEGALKWSETELVTLWEDENELVHFAGNGTVTGFLSLSDLQRTHEVGYIKTPPRTIYLTPIFGLGAAGEELLWLWQWLAAVAPEFLVSLGAGWLIEDALPSPKEAIRQNRLTQKARKQAQDFRERGIHASEQIRLWAASREWWIAQEGAKKLGVPLDLMEAIFTALGYKKRHEDQKWRLGETEEYRQRHESWIEGEPTWRRIKPID